MSSLSSGLFKFISRRIHADCWRITAFAISLLFFAPALVQGQASETTSEGAPAQESPTAAPPRPFNNAPPPAKKTGSEGTEENADAENADADKPLFPNPEAPKTPTQTGRFRTASGFVKVNEQLLDAFKDSVVRVNALDGVGNSLGEAMGVAVGVADSGIQEGDSIYIATSLSLVLGNSMEWADQILCTHDSGASYTAEIALIDEQLDLVLLKPKNKPSPIRFVPESQERAQVSVITISFERDRKNEIVPKFHRGVVAAVNPEEGSLALSGKTFTDNQSGTAIINLQGQLMGMLLPKSNGVLSSGITRAIRKAKGREAFSPKLVGVIMGRGLVVDPTLKGAYPSIEAALSDLRKGDAPKADPTRFLKAYTDEFKPKAAERPVLKIASGIFRIQETLSIPANLSISGSGPGSTMLVAQTADKPLLKIEAVEKVSIANLRLIPATSQKENVPTVEVRKAKQITFQGTIIESKGGRAAVHLHEGSDANFFGNSFPEGKSKAIYCQNSNLKAEANAFLGGWPQALALGTGCSANVTRNLFVANEIATAVSGSARSLSLSSNTFLRGVVGLRIYGTLANLDVEDNLFVSNRYSIFTSVPLTKNQIGRNAAWQSVAFHNDKALAGLDFVKGKVEFRNQDRYDLRLLSNSAAATTGVPSEAGEQTDIGAFQTAEFVGPYTPQLIASLEAALGEKNLAEAWGFKVTKPNNQSSGPTKAGAREQAQSANAELPFGSSE